MCIFFISTGLCNISKIAISIDFYWKDYKEKSGAYTVRNSFKKI